MRPGIQSFLQAAGESACYALDIISIAEEVLERALDPCSALILGIDNDMIKYNWSRPKDADNFWVNDPGGFLSLLTGQDWYVHKEHSGYQLQFGEYLVERWEREATPQPIGHFRRPYWDSLLSSLCVETGTLVSYRVFSPVAKGVV